MSEYLPDKFVLIDYGTDHSPKERYAVLAGFYGGFAGSNSWKRSSSISFAEVVDDKQIVATTYSGSKYVLYKACVGTTMVTQSLLSQAQLETIDEWEEIVKIAKGENNV